MVKKRRFRRKAKAPIATHSFLAELLVSMGGRPGRARLALLWDNWQEVMGGNLWQLAKPLGTRGKVLLIGAENAVHMQELQFMAEEILERANAFLQISYFETVRFSIYQTGKSCRGSRKKLPQPDRINASEAVRIAPSGKYLKDMDPDSPVARCYAAFAKRKV